MPPYGNRRPVTRIRAEAKEAKGKKIKDPKIAAEKAKILSVRKAAEKNLITEKALLKAGVPKELHEAVRITAQKIHGKRFVFVHNVAKKISLTV